MKATLPPRFEIVGEIGRGSMGVVYHARDRALSMDVALKRATKSAADVVVQRFRREAAHMALFSHRNIVRLLDIVQHDGEEYLVMEYVDGGNLLDFSERRPPLTEVMQVFSELCDGLHQVHACGVVHRDVKPSNILFTHEGVPKITDFGISRHTGRTSDLTMRGTILGSFHYLAPEQIGASSDVGPPADMYALGVCLFQTVTGTLPFKAATFHELLSSHIRSAPPSPRNLNPRVSEALNGLILQMLEKEPQQRPGSCEEIRHRLREILEQEKLP